MLKERGRGEYSWNSTQPSTFSVYEVKLNIYQGKLPSVTENFILHGFDILPGAKFSSFQEEHFPSGFFFKPSFHLGKENPLGKYSYLCWKLLPLAESQTHVRNSYSFAHQDGFSTVEDGESVKNSYSVTEGNFPLYILSFT